MTCKQVIKYILWNAFLFGTLFFGYYADEKKLAGIIIGIIYFFIVASYVLCTLFYEQVKNELKKSFPKRYYFYIADSVLIALFFLMGYKKISLCAFVEYDLFILLKYKMSQEEENDATAKKY
jgi:hypothetical protein